MNEEYVNIFKESTYDYYMIRPDDLEETNYFKYFKNSEIVLNNSKRKLPLKAKKYKDKKVKILYKF